MPGWQHLEWRYYYLQNFGVLIQDGVVTTISVTPVKMPRPSSAR
jgi:hypothetical protein